jgi:hypothetical protein
MPGFATERRRGAGMPQNDDQYGALETQAVAMLARE